MTFPSAAERSIASISSADRAIRGRYDPAPEGTPAGPPRTVARAYVCAAHTWAADGAFTRTSSRRSCATIAGHVVMGRLPLRTAQA
jgi:hypothetical protein